MSNVECYNKYWLLYGQSAGEGREYETVTGVCSNIVTSSNQSITCHYSEHFHHEPQDLCVGISVARVKRVSVIMFIFTRLNIIYFPRIFTFCFVADTGHEPGYHTREKSHTTIGRECRGADVIAGGERVPVRVMI